MKPVRAVSCLLVLLAPWAFARADEAITNVLSPIVSYQFPEDFGSEALQNGGLLSAAASYQYPNDLTSDVLSNGGLLSPITSYQFPNNFSFEALANGGLESPFASYQYFEWPGSDVIQVDASPLVSFFYDGGVLGAGSSVSGQVLNGASGLGVAGATVQLGTALTVSDAQGHYSFGTVMPGQYPLTASKAGYNEANDTISVAPASSPARVLTLQPTGVTGSAPRVTGITSKYSGFRYYLDGSPLSVRFTTTVDWAGHSPGTVQFITPKKTYTVSATGSTASQTLAMGSDFGPNGRLRVVAVSGDGTSSPQKQADLLVMANPFPGFLSPLWSVDDEGSNFSYSQRTTSPQSFIDAGVDTGVIPSDIPLFGGKAMDLGFLPDVTFTVDSEQGVLRIWLAWSDANAAALLENDWSDGRITDLTDHLTKFINIGSLTKAEVPHAGFGDFQLSLYPTLAGGWKYSVDLGQWEWWSSQLGVIGDFSIEQTWPFLAGPIPMYAKVKLDLSADATAELRSTSPMSLNGEFDLTPSLRGSLGVGISEVASVEGWVEGGLNLDLQYPTTPTVKDASVYVKAGATVYLVLFTHEWSLPPKSWDIYTPQASLAALAMKPSSGPQPLERAYLSFRTHGSMAAEPATRARFGSSGASQNPETLLSPAFPFSDPDCSSTGTNFYLVFLEDNTNRTSLNRTRTMFSSYDGSSWTAPIPLGDDGTADFHPRILTFADGSAVATWEDEAIPQPNAATLGDMETNLEISVAWFSPGTHSWLPALRMSTNSFLDRSPKLAGKTQDNVLVTWIANTASDPDGSPNAPNTIWSSKWNGSTWSTPQVVVPISNALVKYDLAYDGTNGNLVLSVDTVSGSTNANGHELFRLSYQGGAWGALTQLTSDSVPDDNPQMAFDTQGHILLTWLKGTELSSVSNFNMPGRQVIRTNEYSSNLADFKLATGGNGKLAILWPEPSENDSDLRALIYDPASQLWGAPRQLTHDPQTELGTTAAFYGTNEVIAVYNRRMINSSNSAGSTLTELMAYYYSFNEDLALDSSFFYCDPANPSPGGIATFHARALNLGDKAETNVVVAFYQNTIQPASEIGRLTLTNTLAPQATNDFTFAWFIPGSSSNLTVFAVIDPDQTVPDLSRSNNVAQLDLIKPDVSVQSMNWSKVASNLVAVTVRVANNGAISNGPCTLSFDQDSTNGPTLYSEDISSLLPGESVDVTFLWNVTDLPDNLNILAVLSGGGMANNFSSSIVTRSLSISQVLPPWFGACQYLTNGTFQMEVFGELGRSYALQASTNLTDWIPILNFPCTNSPTILVDTASSNFGKRFYRIAPISTIPRPRLGLDTHPGSTNRLTLVLETIPGIGYTIESSADLVNWTAFTNFTSTNSLMRLVDPAVTGSTRRFYRAMVR